MTKSTPPAGRRQPVPRWVKIAGAVTVLSLIGLAVMLMMGGHGPGQHGGGNHGDPAVTQTHSPGHTGGAR